MHIKRLKGVKKWIDFQDMQEVGMQEPKLH